MKLVAAEEIDGVLTFPILIDALADAFAARGTNPPRHHHAIGEGTAHATHLIMPAWTEGAPGAGQFLGTKLVNVFPGNGTLGLPAVLGTYVLQSGETGQPLAILDGTRLTHWRTAAASGLAARYLAPAESAALTMVGSGALAPFLVRAHASVRPIRRVTVWNLDLVGAFSLAMREADDEALRLCRIFVDTPSALEEGGDVALGLRSGVVTVSDVVADLHGLCRGEATGRSSATERTLFKSVGAALEDLAAAILVWRLLAAE